jgi:hypothetical protein
VKFSELFFCCIQVPTHWHRRRSDVFLLEALRELEEARMVDVHTAGWVARIMAADMLGQGDRVEWSLAARSEFHRVCSVA